MHCNIKSSFVDYVQLKWIYIEVYVPFIRKLQPQSYGQGIGLMKLFSLLFDKNKCSIVKFYWFVLSMNKKWPNLSISYRIAPCSTWYLFLAQQLLISIGTGRRTVFRIISWNMASHEVVARCFKYNRTHEPKYS